MQTEGTYLAEVSRMIDAISKTEDRARKAEMKTNLHLRPVYRGSIAMGLIHHGVCQSVDY